MLRVSCYNREIKCQVDKNCITEVETDDKIQDKMFKILFVIINTIFILMNSLSHFY